MKKLAILAVGAVGLAAIPALADHHGGKMEWKEPTTRAEVEAQVKERFAAVDTNKDGAVTKAEADAHATSMKADWQAKAAEHHARMFTEMDTDKNGQISRAEFDAAHQARMTGREEAHDDGRKMGGGRMMMHHGPGEGMGQMWFDRIDANKDGKVTLAEALAKPLEMFDRADANKDGTLTPEERKAAWEARLADRKDKPGS